MFMQKKKFLLWQNGKYSGEKELSFCKFIDDDDEDYTEHIFLSIKASRN